MKKLLLPATPFLLLFGLLVAAQHKSSTTQAQSGAPAQGLEARVATLESELATEKRRGEEMRALLEQTLLYLDKQTKAAQAILPVLDESEQQGFAAGDNWRSRQTLLAGMRAYWGAVQSGAPRLPAPRPVEPAAPARPVRPQ